MSVRPSLAGQQDGSKYQGKVMKIISFFNHKGGVSKTTSTFHVGWKLAELGYKVLLGPVNTNGPSD
ncbi:ParA family protein [Xanthomonas hortorum]|uniref:ParA family protein n=1 Tax=Xanthomonas hortorum TaxID=56454 RepID=UPI000A5833D6